MSEPVQDFSKITEAFNRFTSEKNGQIWEAVSDIEKSCQEELGLLKENSRKVNLVVGPSFSVSEGAGITLEQSIEFTVNNSDIRVELEYFIDYYEDSMSLKSIVFGGEYTVFSIFNEDLLFKRQLKDYTYAISATDTPSLDSVLKTALNIDFNNRKKELKQMCIDFLESITP